MQFGIVLLRPRSFKYSTRQRFWKPFIHFAIRPDIHRQVFYGIALFDRWTLGTCLLVEARDFSVSITNRADIVFINIIMNFANVCRALLLSKMYKLTVVIILCAGWCDGYRRF